jgi:diaminohydroxyphosphoribosylaminopyrimidine deaminase/5-amino-6-(5-phosphoribosylamino)uracil reductase
MDIHEKYMRMALGLALKAQGRTSPNPLVGAVVVRNGKVVGKGYHKRCGLPHAEVNALRMAGRNARGATLYVTLEPCGHFGRTPPCTGAVVRSGVRKVVVGMKDPNPINNGRGIRRLRRYGLAVSSGVFEEEAMSINRPYIKFITRKIPYVTVKAAQTLDGKIATRTGDSRWVTGEDSRRFVHELRGKVDAVMVGANTAVKDDPLLLSKSSGRQPVRVIVSAGLKIPRDLRIFSTIKRSPVIIATTRKSQKASILERKGVEVMAAGSKSGKVDMKNLLKALAKRGITHVLAEGGGELIASLLEGRLADRLLFFVAPKIAGGADAVTSVEGRGAGRMRDAIALKNVSVRRFKKDILIEAEV